MGFAAELDRLGWSIRVAAQRLGKDKMTIVRWRAKGAPAEIMARLQATAA